MRFPRIDRANILLGFFMSAFLFTTFPGKGGLEGDQRTVALLSERNDNWGFLVPFLYGEWPDLLGHWRFSLVLLQLCILWLGLHLLIPRHSDNGRSSRFLLFLIIYVSSVFASQLWRDSTLFVFTVFGLGVANFALNDSLRIRKMLLFVSLFCLLIAAMFKPLFGIIIGFFFVWLLVQRIGRTKFVSISSILIVVFLGLAPFFLDKALGNFVGLKKTYPEQQPIIFDLASNYCWGSSDQLVSDAADGLKLVLKDGFPIESTCASLRPNSWDNLHTNPMKWEFSSPLFRITGENESKVRNLQKKWISMIVHNPVDWIQTRAIYIGPTLLMSNSFTEQAALSSKPRMFELVNYYGWKFISLPASILDKTRLTSLGFSCVFLLFLVLRNFRVRNIDSGYFKSIDLLMATFLILLTISITISFFTANNGRYVLPFVLLTYIFLFRSLRFRSPIQV